MSKKYQIMPVLWYINDEASVKFHIKSDDYFGTIATVLGLLKDKIKKDGCPNVTVLNKTISNLENDLLFLQKNYQIKPKAKKENKSPKGRLKSQ
jgi:mannitol-specific phosphotransferase system IIBC component